MYCVFIVNIIEILIKFLDGRVWSKLIFILIFLNAKNICLIFNLLSDFQLNFNGATYYYYATLTMRTC